MIKRFRPTTVRYLTAAACLAATFSCRSPEKLANDADRQVYGIIGNKSRYVPEMKEDFSLERSRYAPPPAADLTLLDLADSLSMAATHNRTFQTQKENVYFEALSLTLERHLWDPSFFGRLDGRVANTDDDTFFNGGSSFGFDWALATGGEIAVSFASDFVRYLSGDPRQTAASALQFALRQPLLRGAGSRVAQEPLVQAERNAIYEIRSFIRFRREFWVDTASTFYRLLEQGDIVENEKMNLQNLVVARKRAEMLTEAGRMPGYQVDQARQDELRARDRWLRAAQQYETLLDSFKIQLGLPLDTEFSLDNRELMKLRDLIQLDSTGDQLADAVTTALENRLDLKTSHDRVVDAARQIFVARDLLRPELDLLARASIGTKEPDHFLSFTDEERNLSLGFDLDLPLDRFSERNTYRRAQILFQRRERELSLLRDQVVQQVRRAWRQLEEAKASYEIQVKSVELAEQRVEGTTLLMEAGRAEMRDLLEAQESLVQARNQLTSRLIDHYVALLQLWRDMGVLVYDDQQLQSRVR